MNTLETRLRDTWDAEPASLDRFAVRWVEEGASRNELLDALESLLRTVRCAGEDEARDERILQVMDRLESWCHANFRIEVPTNPKATIEMNDSPDRRPVTGWTE